MAAPAWITSLTVETRPGAGGTWVAISPIDDIQVEESWGGSADLPLQFGAVGSARARIVFRRGNLPAPWSNAQYRISTTVDGVTNEIFRGMPESLEDDDTADTVTLSLRDFSVIIERMRRASPLFVNRPIATSTSATSIEDPSNANYTGGPINWLLWAAGGRPWEQSGNPSYAASATFWYSLEQADLVPSVAWFARENGWSEVDAMAKASGGIVFQDRQGVIRYRQLLPAKVGTPTATLTTDMFGTLSETRPVQYYLSGVNCAYQGIELRNTQEVLNDTTVRQIWPGQTLTIPLDLNTPILETTLISATATTLKDEAVTILDPQGRKVLLSSLSNMFTAVAQEVTITISNTRSTSVFVTNIVLQAQPIARPPGLANTFVVGDNVLTETLQANIYLQDALAAERFAEMHIITRDIDVVRVASDVVEDNTITVGSVVPITYAKYGITAENHIVTGIQRDGSWMSLTLVPLASFPLRSAYWVVSSSTQTGSKLIAW